MAIEERGSYRPDTSPINSDSSRPRRGGSMWIAVALVLVAAVVAWFAYNSLRSQSLVDDTLREQFVWHMVPALPDTATPGPRTTVNLQIADANVPVGTFQGNCTIVDDKTLALLSGELSGVVCTAGDSGVEIGIFKEKEQLVLKRGEVVSGQTRGSNFMPLVQTTTGS